MLRFHTQLGITETRSITPLVVLLVICDARVCGFNIESSFFPAFMFHMILQDRTDRPQHLLQQVSDEMRGSIPESLSEFFDAKEYLLSSSSSENEVRGWQSRYISNRNMQDKDVVRYMS